MAVVDGAPVVATIAGLLDGNAGALLPIPQRYGPKTGLATCVTAEGAECAQDTDGARTWWMVPAGGSISLRAEGASLALDATVGVLSVADGEDTVGTLAPGQRVGLSDGGWHALRLSALSEAEIAWIDLYPEAAPANEPPAREGCGCTSARPSVAGAPLAGLRALWTRRRGAPRPR